MSLGERNRSIKIRVVADLQQTITPLLQQAFPRIEIDLLPHLNPPQENETEDDLHIVVDSPQVPLQESWLHWLQQHEIPFLVVGQGTSRETILKIFRTGAQDYIEAVDGYTDSLIAIVSNYVANCLKTRNISRCLVFLGANGGVGASSLVANIGASLSQSHKDVLLLDAASRAGDLASLLNLHPDHFLDDLVNSRLELDGEVLRQSVVNFNSHISLLSSREDFKAQTNIFPGEMLHPLLRMANQEFSYTLVDTGGRNAEFIAPIIPLVDLFVAPFLGNLISLRRLRFQLNLLREAGVPEEAIFVIENRKPDSGEFSRSQIEKILRCEVQSSIPDAPATFTHSLNCGVPICHLEKRTHAGKALQKTVETLRQRLHGTPPIAATVSVPTGFRRWASCLGFM